MTNGARKERLQLEENQPIVRVLPLGWDAFVSEQLPGVDCVAAAAPFAFVAWMPGRTVCYHLCAEVDDKTRVDDDFGREMRALVRNL